MTNHDYKILKKELSTLYLEITDCELNDATHNLINFYETATKAIMELDPENNNTPQQPYNSNDNNVITKGF